MIKLSPYLGLLFGEFPERTEQIAAVGEAGLPACEFPHCSPQDVDAIIAAKEQAGVAIAAFAIAAEQGILDVSLAEEFVRCTQEAVEVAHRLEVKVLICGPGEEDTSRPRSEQHAAVVACLQAAAPVAEAAGITLALEPVNVIVDHPGQYLSESAEAFEILDEVGSPNVKLLYDIYHQQVTEGNLIATITSHIDQIAHFHLADVPGRHEPGTGEINWENVLGAIDEAGYEGYVGLEYFYTTDTLQSLEYLLAVVNSL